MNLFDTAGDPRLDGTADQFRLRRMQILNWGTLDGLFEVDISAEGHLFTGKSGSGKSTVLDAHSAILIPKVWRNYNAAAVRESDKKSGDRENITYIRGAHAKKTSEETGEGVTEFLRTGPTVSILSETYTNGHKTSHVLGALLWVADGSTHESDVKFRYFVAPAGFQVQQLEFFPLGGFDPRSLKSKLPAVTFFEDHSSFRERFCPLLGIEDKVAIRLLHKAQSTKDLENLSHFLRNYMLDDPETFEIADRLVVEFQDLKGCYDAVVDARNQRDHLLKIRNKNEELEAHSKALKVAQTTEELVPGYFSALGRAILESDLQNEMVNRSQAVQSFADVSGKLETTTHARLAAEAKLAGIDGGRLASVENELARAIRQRSAAEIKFGVFNGHVKALGWMRPQSHEEFLRLQEQARNRLVSNADDQVRTAEELRESYLRQEDLKRSFDSCRSEIRSMESRSSNIEEDLQNIRDRIVGELRVPRDDLPFAGELLEVQVQEKTWRGAIERVLSSFSQSLLVPPKHFAQVHRFINQNHLGAFLRFTETKPHHRACPEPASVSLVRKLAIKTGPFEDWMRDELRERFDYACVSDTKAMESVPRGVTIEGSVKHSSMHHEKNDRFRIDDARRWHLGFDVADRLAEFKRRAQELADQLATASQTVQKLQERDRKLSADLVPATAISTTGFEEVDVSGMAEAVALLESQLQQLKEDRTVAELTALIDAMRSQERMLEESLEGLRNQRSRAESRIELIRTTRELQEFSLPPLSADQVAHLEAFAASKGAAIPPLSTLEDLRVQREHFTRTVVRRAVTGLGNAVNDSRTILVADMVAFNGNFKAVSAGLEPVAASCPEYLLILEVIEEDRLPSFLDKFREMLSEQSDNNLTRLVARMDLERREIRGRLTKVNEALRLIPFNRERGTFLVIESKDAGGEEVMEFKKELRECGSDRYEATIEAAELRFARIAALVGKLSKDGNREMQRRLLDVRQHMVFHAREFDSAGVEVNLYESGASKSGGQRQLLSATVLAAALAYQLGGSERKPPVFSTVVLDEAFEKADSDFTYDALNIFRNLGFQLVLATPGKHVETIQTFIGSASLVTIRDGKKSHLFNIEYDATDMKLKLAPDAVS